MFRLFFVIATLTLLAACATNTTDVAPTPAAAPAWTHVQPVEPPTMTAETVALLTAVTPQSREAYEHLRRASIFEEEAISYDGHVSANVEAFRELRQDPMAVSLFKALAEEGTTIAKLYAAIGLFDLDSEAYEGTVASLESHLDERIPIHSGCFMDQVRLGDLVKAPDNAIVLEPGQTLMSWLREHETGHMDIVGGAYTSSFSHAGR